MDSPVKDILGKLRALDLSTYPAKEAQTLIEKLVENMEDLAFYVCLLSPGKYIVRARLGGDFHSRCELGYRHPKLNKIYSRACIPGSTMFYGTLPADYDDSEGVALVVAHEISSWLNADSPAQVCEKITFSEWVVTKEITLVSFMRKNEIPHNLYTSQLTANSNFQHFQEFFANEFSKANVQSDFEYLLSAVCSDVFLKNSSCGGILYPTIYYPDNRPVFNVAIKPKIADNNLMLTFVEERTVYKNGNKVFCNSDKICELYEHQTHFVYVDSPMHHPIEMCLRKIGVDNMQDLLPKTN
ncbi:MAG: hypothetical protein LBR10_03960 [Prevotellaceae bacterium]|jgi:hypothetical protein|nr:hypothetical protein [Prevotellaceae bacterium]